MPLRTEVGEPIHRKRSASVGKALAVLGTAGLLLALLLAGALPWVAAFPFQFGPYVVVGPRCREQNPYILNYPDGRYLWVAPESYGSGGPSRLVSPQVKWEWGGVTVFEW
jgi:hypothetical protein